LATSPRANKKKPPKGTSPNGTTPETPAGPPPDQDGPKRAANRKSFKGVDVSPDDRVSLYSQARFLPEEFRKKCGLLLPFTTYFQDPFVAKNDPQQTLDEEVCVPWEPGVTDGPTSSRFAIVDYNADTGTLEPPAVWNDATQTFVGPDGVTLDKDHTELAQFRQVSVWALVQGALAFYEDGIALGRRIPWAFEGNRLIVVPHAGYGENAYYDRSSKSLQFYYFGSDEDTVYTCLSTDIVHHELGHAILDGIRPFFNESSQPQTAAFHEFMGDLSAILLTLNNDTLRGSLALAAGGDMDKATSVFQIAEQFGNAVQGRPYLRTAKNDLTMGKLAGETSPHHLSELLTGAMFDILTRIGEQYQRADRKHGARTPKQAFYYAAERMQRMAIQPLDLLPPVEVTFRDYAKAVCRSQRLADPIDPDGYYDLLIDVFRKREILSQEDEDDLREPQYLIERLSLSVRHDIDDISRSRAAAYRFVDDNREDLLIPANRDFFIADLYDAQKRGRQRLRMPRQIILQYAWREEIDLAGPQFGKFTGRTTTMLCGGTLVFNEDGNVLSWMMKPGSLAYGGKRARAGKVAENWRDAIAAGLARRQGLLETVAAQIAAGRIGTLLGSPHGLMGSHQPPMTAEDDGDVVRFKLSPHLHLSEDEQEAIANQTGERQWEISC
jgi:hypothetical protein